jgi:PKD repeat protein
MKNALLFSFLFLSLFFASNTVKASHLMAGEITYKAINGDSILVTVKIYRDCNGIQISNSPLFIRSEKKATANFTLTEISVKDVTGIGPNCGTNSRCSGSYPYGIEEHVYQVIAVLPNDGSCKYTISWEQAARNTAITTGAAGGNFYIETTLNKCIAPNNSSPEFIRNPVILISVGQDISINHTAVDPDNDFLTYELINPLQGAGSSIAYSSNWSISSPITYLGFPKNTLSWPSGFRFDTISGNMSFRPTKQNEVTVITVKVKEWRKISGSYVLIGETMRDVQLIVLSSTGNTSPMVGNPDSAWLNVCSPGSFCVDIPVTDADSSDTLSMVYKHNLPNATINVTSIAPNHKVVNVCFTVDTNMFLSGIGYFLSLYVEDNGCPLPGKVEKTYFTRYAPLVTGFPPLPDVFVCETDSPFTLLNNGFGSWNGAGVSGDSTGYTFSPVSAQKGWHLINYSYTDSFSSCYFSDSLNVRVVAQPQASFIVNDSNGFITDTFVFTNTSVADTSFISVWDMGDSIGVPIVQQDPQYRYSDTGQFTVKLWVSNGICAPDSFIKTNFIHLAPNYLTAKTKLVCETDSSFQLLHPVPSTGTWSGAGVSTDSTGYIFTPQSVGTGWYPAAYYYYDSATSFTFYDTLWVRVLKRPVPDFAVNDTIGYPTDSFAFTNNTAADSAYNSLWNFGQSGIGSISTSQNPLHTYFDTGYFTVTLWVSNGICPTDSVIKTSFIHVKSNNLATKAKWVCETDSAFILVHPTPSSGSWSGSGVSGGSSGYSFSPQSAGAGWHQIIYYYYDSATSYTLYDTLFIRVLQRPVPAFTVNDTTGYPTHTFAFTNNTTADSAYNSLWNFGHTGIGNISSNPNPSYTYNDTGFFTVTLWVSNGICPTDSLIKTNYIRVVADPATTGLLSATETGLKIYPTPTANVVYIETEANIRKIDLIDITGRINSFATPNGGNKAELNLEWLSEGVYVLQVTDVAGKIYSGKVLIQR